MLPRLPGRREPGPYLPVPLDTPQAFEPNKQGSFDLYTRECPGIDVGQSLKGEDLVRVLSGIVLDRG